MTIPANFCLSDSRCDSATQRNATMSGRIVIDTNRRVVRDKDITRRTVTGVTISAGEGHALAGKNGVGGMRAAHSDCQSSGTVTVMTSDSSAIRLGEATTVTMALGAVIPGVMIRIVTDFAWAKKRRAGDVKIVGASKRHHVVNQFDCQGRFLTDSGRRNRLKKVFTVLPVTNQLDIATLVGVRIVAFPAGDISRLV